MKSNLNSWIAVALIVVCSQTVFIQVTPQPFCFVLPRSQGAHYKIFYQSVSDHSTVNATLEARHIEKTYLSGYSNQTTVSGSEDIELCLQNQSGKQSVSIDFYLSQQSTYKQLALKSQVQEVHQQLINVGMTLKEIAHLEQFQQQRQLIQSQIIQKHQKTIFMYSVLKVGIIVLIGISQLILLERKIGMHRLKSLIFDKK